MPFRRRYRRKIRRFSPRHVHSWGSYGRTLRGAARTRPFPASMRGVKRQRTWGDVAHDVWEGAKRVRDIVYDVHQKYSDLQRFMGRFEPGLPIDPGQLQIGY